MAETTTTRSRPASMTDNDLVPDQWKSLFNNQEWLTHRIIVLTTYGFLAIACVAHLLMWNWIAWFQ